MLFRVRNGLITISSCSIPRIESKKSSSHGSESWRKQKRWGQLVHLGFSLQQVSSDVFFGMERICMEENDCCQRISTVKTCLLWKLMVLKSGSDGALAIFPVENGCQCLLFTIFTATCWCLAESSRCCFVWSFFRWSEKFSGRSLTQDIHCLW